MSFHLLLRSLLILSLFFVGKVFATEGEWREVTYAPLHGMGSQLHQLTLERQDNGKSYHLVVRAPQTTEKTKNETYPVVYLLDAGITFPMLASYYHLLNLLGELPDVIIVGISYGTDDWRKGNNRSVDFTASSKERDHWGGAPGLFNVFRNYAISGRREAFSGRQ